MTAQRPAPPAPRSGPTYLDQAATLLPQGALRGLSFRWAPQAGTGCDTETSLLHPGTRQHVTDSRVLPVLKHRGEKEQERPECWQSGRRDADQPGGRARGLRVA